MKIRELIDSLEERAKLSDEGDQTEVTLNLHVLEYNGSGYYIETEIVEVSNIWGGGDKDACLIEAILSEDDVNKLRQLKDELAEIE